MGTSEAEEKMLMPTDGMQSTTINPQETDEIIRLRSRQRELEAILIKKDAGLMEAMQLFGKMRSSHDQQKRAFIEERGQFQKHVQKLQNTIAQYDDQLKKTKRQYQKVLRSRNITVHKHNRQMEITPLLYYSSLNSNHCRRSVHHFLTIYSKVDHWLDDGGSPTLYKLEFERQEIHLRFSLLYPVLILMGTICGIDKGFLSYVMLLGSSVSAKK